MNEKKYEWWNLFSNAWYYLLLQEKASALPLPCRRHHPKWQPTRERLRWPSTDRGSRDRKRVSGSCDTLCDASIARSIRRGSAAPPRGFPENVPIIQRKSLYTVMGSHYRADGARWCSGRCAYRAWCVFRAIRAPTHTHTRGRQCFYRTRVRARRIR